MYSIIERNVPDLRCELNLRGLLHQDEELLFQIGNHAFTETLAVGGWYIYRAIEIESGVIRQYGKRKTRLCPSQYDIAAEKIMMMPGFEACALPSVLERGKRLIVLIFREILPEYGFSYRLSQAEMSQTVYRAIKGRQIALCEAGTGSGKTLAYLVATVVYSLFQHDKRTTILSTSTIALQKAISEEYLPKLSDILLTHQVIEKPLSFVIRKGKAHYVCDLRLQGYQSSIANLEGDNGLLLNQLEALAAARPEQIDLSLYPLTRYVKDRICVSGRCLSNCPKHSNCRFLRHLDTCMQKHFDFQILNHPYVFAHFLQGRHGGKGLLPEYRVVVFDEAHKLLDAARQIYGTEYARSELEALVKDIPTGRFGSVHNRAAVEAMLEYLLMTNTHLFELATSYGQPECREDTMRFKVVLGTPALRCIATLLERLEKLCSFCALFADKQFRRQLPALQLRSRDITEKLITLSRPDSHILWMEARGKDQCLCAIPKELESRLQSDVWQKNMPAVLTSGTLSVNGDYSLLRRSIGLAATPQRKLIETGMPSPFDYKGNTLLYIPKQMPFPDIQDKAYVNAICQEIQQLVWATHGHTLALFTSYRLMELVFTQISGDIAKKYPAFILKRGRVDILSKYRNSGNGVLFASDAAGEGIDLPGDILSSLIIVKLPFAVPDPISEFERSQYSSLQEFQKKVVVPSMLVKLRQYTGRAIRSVNDTAVISILDSRIGVNGKYRGVVLDALPQAPVTSKLIDVKTFIATRKETSYFASSLGTSQ